MLLTGGNETSSAVALNLGWLFFFFFDANKTLERTYPFQMGRHNEVGGWKKCAFGADVCLDYKTDLNDWM